MINLDKIKKLNPPSPKDSGFGEASIPKAPGCYQFLDKKGGIIYIGKAADLRGRVSSYWSKSANHTPAKQAMLEQISRIKWIETDSEIEALLLEANLIKKHQPEFNVVLRDDKRFSYIKISTEDEIPGVFITRQIEKRGKYFGPFTSATAVRETLKAIRKIWPYCAERKIKSKPCFYSQIGRCTGVCGGNFSVKEYKDKVVRPIVLFLEGGKSGIIKNQELGIRNYESGLKNLKPESKKYLELLNEIKFAKFQLKNMKQVLEHTRVLSVSEKYAADVVELAKVLNLSKVPERIEGYDISNIFGKEAVGSMVVFAGGEPDKSEYRKFKIKIGEGQVNDVKMLKEVLERRFKHSPSPGACPERSRGEGEGWGEVGDGWPSPDLIIVDGGKAQLNAALSVLKKFDSCIPVLAVAKGKGLRSAQAPDKIFFPGEKKPLELSLSSPALHIIKRARDEAHRFAISYHRKLRGKRVLKN